MLLVFPAGKKKRIPTRSSKKGGWDVTSEVLQRERNMRNSEKIFLEDKLESDKKFLLNHVLDAFITKMAVWTSCISLNLQRRLQFWAVMLSYLPKSCTWEKTYQASTSCCLDELCVPLGQQLHDSCREVSPAGTARYTRICLWTNWRLSSICWRN